MKKSFAILFLCLLILPLFLNILMSQETGIPSGLNPEQIENTTQGISAQFDYLAREWKNILLANPTINAIDAFFQKASVVFFILFGIQYSLSPALFFTLLLWFFFLIAFFGIFKNFASFKKWISLIIAFLLVIVMSHIGLIEKQANFLAWLLFSDKPWWMRLLFIFGIFAVIVIVLILENKFGKQFEKKKKKQKEEADRMKVETAAKAGQPWVEALSKEGKE